MGAVAEAFVAAYRNFSVDGVPASGRNKPNKADLRALGSLVEQALGTVGIGSVNLTKTTKALLDADLAHGAGSTAIVYADGTDANNDLYVKSGASGTGSWTNTGALHSIMEGLNAPYLTNFDAVLAEFTERANSLFQVQQSVGYPDVIPDGTGDVAGTYALSTPIDQRGDGVVLGIFSAGTGTVYAQIASVAGSTKSVVREAAIAVTPGYAEYTVADLPHEAGQFFGFRSVAGLVRFSVADPGYGYWSSGGTQVSTGGTYSGDEAGGVTFHIRFNSVKDYAKGANAAEIDSLARQVSNPDFNQVVIGRAAGSTLVDGVPAGTSYYVFEAVAPIDVVMHTFRIYGEAAGEVELSSWEGPDDDIEQVERLRVTIVPGLNVIPVRLVLRRGGRLGIRARTGNFSLTSPTAQPTPFRSISGTSGALGDLNSSIRFELIAEFVPYTLTERIERLEAGDYDNPTEAFHAVWMLGESHVAGRATDFDLSVAQGRGYNYRRADTSLGQLADPTGNDDTATGAPVRGSYGPSIGKGMLDQTGGSVGALIINSAEGGTKAGAEWATAGAAWVQAKADWDAAMAEAEALPLSGLSIVLNIGSNDVTAGTAKATYKAAMIDLIARAKAYVGAGSSVPVLLVMTGPFPDGSGASGVADMQAAQAEITREVAGVYMASSAPRFAADRGWFYDNPHFTQALNDIVGPAIATVALARGSGLMPS